MDVRLKRIAKWIPAALISSVKTPLRAASTFLFSFLFFFVLSINSYASRNIALLTESIFNADLVVLNGYGTFLSQGLLRLSLITLYVVLAGAAVTNFGVRISSKELDFKTAFGVIPGFFAAGCGCGIGLLGVLGIGSSVGLATFGGNWLIALGILLVLYAHYSFGDPDVCGLEINVES